MSYNFILTPQLIMQKLSSTQIIRILNLLDSGHSVRQISNQTGYGIATISRTRSEHRPELQKSSGGRPTKLSTANVEYARRIIRMGKVDNATEAAKSIQDITNTPFSSQTLRRHLKSRGMKPVVKRKRPLLKPHHRWA
jgi:transposase